MDNGLEIPYTNNAHNTFDWSSRVLHLVAE